MLSRGFIYLLLLISLSGYASEPCLLNQVNSVIDAVVPTPAKNVKTKELVEDALDFAQTNNLPYQVIEFGPEERRVKRLVIGVDQTNEAARNSYIERYLHTKPLEKGEVVKGVIPIEVQRESKVQPEHYVTGVPRLSTNKDDKIWRWGTPNNQMPINYEDWWKQWFNGPNNTHRGYLRHGDDNSIIGYSHLIPLNSSERENFEFFLANKDLRAPCKSDNCIAWISNIELGKTAKDATDAERKFLLPELGVSRSMAHFEIGRRLMHGTDENHGVVVMFLDGEKGIEAFKSNVLHYIPPEPKIPYSSIILQKIPDDAPVMQAMSIIKDGERVYFPIAAGASPEGMTALVQHAESLPNGVTAQMSISGTSESVLKRSQKSQTPKVKLESLFIGGNQRELNHAGKVDLIHGYLSDFSKRIQDPTDKKFKYDTIVVRVSPPDASGRLSLGPNNDNIMTIIQNNPGIKIIAEINENVPRTTGANFLTEEQITKSFKSDSQLASSPVVPFTPIEEAIGKNLGKLIDDGATVQLGIGNIFDGLPAGIKAEGVKDLKISTEMLGDTLKEVIKSGVVKEAKTGFAFGSTDLYKWLDNNKEVEFVPQAVVNDLTKIRETDGFHAINTALQVDLRGNVNATVGPMVAGKHKRISSPGGQVDFMSSASQTKHGKAIIAIRSTAKNGELSTITLSTYGGEITTKSDYVTHVVTENGIATLQGKTQSEKTLELISVAHPKFQEQLLGEAKVNGLISEQDIINFRVKGQTSFAPRYVSLSDESRDLNFAASEINYKVYNPEAKETVVLIHGLGGDQSTWRQTAQSFEDKGYKVITYDQRGHGKTQAFGGNFSSERMARDLDQLLTHLKITDKVNLVGHSMGARTAIKFASEHPERVKTLILEDMHAKKVFKGKSDPKYATNLIRAIDHSGKRGSREAFIEWLELKKKFPDEASLKQELGQFTSDEKTIEFITTVYSTKTDDGFITISDKTDYLIPNELYRVQGLAEDLSDDLIKVQAPTLFLAADDPTKVLYGVGIEHIQRIKPKAKITTIANSSHGIHQTQPQAFNNAVTSFHKSNGINPAPKARAVASTTNSLKPTRPLSPREINFIDEGFGRNGTIVLIHDRGRDLTSFTKLKESLKGKGYRVIAPDLRGHGKTISQGTNYSPKVLAKDIKAVMDFSGIENASILGVGDGSSIAYQFAIDNPQMTDIVLINKPTKKPITANDPTTILKGLEEIPQVYNSVSEARAALIKKFGKELGEKLADKHLTLKPFGDVVINIEIPTSDFVNFGLGTVNPKDLEKSVQNPIHEIGGIPFIGPSASQIDDAIKSSQPR
jgi:acyl-CoA hydrolase/esterase/lipase